jgi:hypothetical protein
MGGMGGGMPGMMGRMGRGMGRMAGVGAGFGAGSSRRLDGEAELADAPIVPVLVRRSARSNHQSSRVDERSRTETSAGSTLEAGATSGAAAIDLSQRLAELKTEARAQASSTLRTVASRRFRKLGDAWVDEGYKPGIPSIRVRVLGAAYFWLLARRPELGRIFALGEHVTWVSPSGTAIIVSKDGPNEIDHATLDRLFTKKGDKSNF